MKKKSRMLGTVEAVLVGDQIATSTRRKKIELHVGHGVKGDRHAGPRLADVRENAFLDFGLMKGMRIANLREISIISREELVQIAKALRIGEIPFGAIGENLVISGVPKLTDIPIGSVMYFRKGAETVRTAVVMTWGANNPCVVAGQSIQDLYPSQPGLVNRFPKAAMGKRGIVGFVFCSGFISEGDTVEIHFPQQRPYKP